jgi:hypothetical protein
MAEISPATALRQLQQAQAGMKRARHALQVAREDLSLAPRALKAGWESLSQAHRLLGSIPLEAATEPVMTRQLAVERYATALLVRLRRLVRNEPGTASDDLDDSDSEDS